MQSSEDIKKLKASQAEKKVCRLSIEPCTPTFIVALRPLWSRELVKGNSLRIRPITFFGVVEGDALVPQLIQNVNVSRHQSA
jgi:hypothetical protein